MSESCGRLLQITMYLVGWLYERTRADLVSKFRLELEFLQLFRLQLRHFGNPRTDCSQSSNARRDVMRPQSRLPVIVFHWRARIFCV